MTRLGDVNGTIHRNSPTFDISTEFPTSSKFPSAPNTPQKPRKTAKISNYGKSIKRKSISLNSSLNAKIREKSELEIATFSEAAKMYDQMPKEDLIRNCQKFGIKKSLGKRQMIIKLKEIYCKSIF